MSRFRGLGWGLRNARLSQLVSVGRRARGQGGPGPMWPLVDMAHRVSVGRTAGSNMSWA